MDKKSAQSIVDSGTFTWEQLNELLDSAPDLDDFCTVWKGKTKRQARVRCKRLVEGKKGVIKPYKKVRTKEALQAIRILREFGQ